MRRITRTAVKTAIAVAMSAVAIAGAATNASAATGADGFTIIHADAGTQVHTCTVAGKDSAGVEAIICVDINTSTWYDPQDGLYWAEAQSQVEAYCQLNNVIIKCTSIDLMGEYSNPYETQTDYNTCSGNCPDGRLYSYSSWYSTSPDYNCGTTTNTGANVWSLARGTETRWYLPGDNTPIILHYGSNGNFSTGHYYVCY